MGRSSRDESVPDFGEGVDPSIIPEGGLLSGHVRGEPALMTRIGAEIFVFGAHCSHYHAPLAYGLLTGETVRCPWHHACFDIRTGRALRAPAFAALTVWRVEWEGAKVFAREKLKATGKPAAPAPAGGPRAIVVVGAGAAGFAAAHALRAEGYDGALTLVGADPAAPYDRPNLSKDYLAGTAPPEWLPLCDPAYFGAQKIEMRLGRRVAALDPATKQIVLDDGERLAFDAALLATGAEPIRLPTLGADGPNVHYLRSLADSDALIGAAKGARRAAVIGASFIGLEVAAALRARGLDVHVIAPEALPMERILGPQLGRFVQSLHESHGVVFHLGDAAARIEAGAVALASGGKVDADIVAIGVGVRPAVALAEQAGLAVDGGVVVDEYLQTSAPGIYAAGDIARWPDRLSGERIRVEHWVVAQRQGQTAARNMLGRRERFDAAPFFWSQHYDAAISYIGHAPSWDRAEMDGDPASGGCVVSYYRAGRKLAVETLFRDLDSLRAEVEFERALAAL